MNHRARRLIVLLAILVGLAAAFASGFTIAATRTPPYRTLLKIMRSVYPAAPLTNPSQTLWRDSYRRPAEHASVVMLGDSITRLGNWPAILGRSDIVNLGIPGDTTAGILQRLDDGNIPKDSAIFLMAGVNDVIMSMPVDAAASNLRKIIDRLDGTHAVYLQSTLLTDSPAFNKDIQELIEHEKAICQELACSFIDLNAVLAPGGSLRPEYEADGIHLNAAGYDAWAVVLRPYLAKARP